MHPESITEELVESWFKDLNTKGWVLTIQGHVMFALHIGSPGTECLSEIALDKYDKSYHTPNVNLKDFEYKHRVVCISKSPKGIDYHASQTLLKLYTTYDQWDYSMLSINGSDRWQRMSQDRAAIFKTEAFHKAWKRCLSQNKAIKTSDNTKKNVAVKHIQDSFVPLYVQTKKKFKLTDDECLAAFKEAVELMTVKTVMEG